MTWASHSAVKLSWSSLYERTVSDRVQRTAGGGDVYNPRAEHKCITRNDMGRNEVDIPIPGECSEAASLLSTAE